MDSPVNATSLAQEFREGNVTTTNYDNFIYNYWYIQELTFILALQI